MPPKARRKASASPVRDSRLLAVRPQRVYRRVCARPGRRDWRCELPRAQDRCARAARRGDTRADARRSPGPLGLSPKKIGEDIAKETAKDWKVSGERVSGFRGGATWRRLPT